MSDRPSPAVVAGTRRRLPGFGLAVAAGVVAGLGLEARLPFLHLAANRLVVGAPISAGDALGGSAWGGAALALAGVVLLAPARRGSAVLACLCLAVALVVLAIGLGDGAAQLLAGQPAATRARLASGAWIGLLVLAGAVATAAARTRVRGAGWITLAMLVAGFAGLYRAGRFDALSLAVEYRGRSGAVAIALVQHATLSAASVVLAAVLCVGLALWRLVRGLVDLVVSGIQVVPAVALLGALVPLVSGLLAVFPGLREAGVSALGPGPAILAVAAYLLLPLWRGLHAALRVPDPAVVEAAAAIGLTPRQILIEVRLPLGAPILVGALRVACVQSVGLATLGALVGAGGLGGLVFDGMAQFAPDLILLGACPIVALSLALERGLSGVEARLRWTGGR